ncbi:MAG: hypothetical protein RIS94_2669 [Pseudomonadota bacterium]
MDRTIISLTGAHRQAAIETLSAAFADDPAMCWLMPDPAARARRLPRLMAWTFDDHLAHGLAFGTPGAEAVTLWRPPGTVHRHAPLTPAAVLRFLGMFGRHILRAERLDGAIARHLPAGEQQFYLRMAAVRPDRQGQGLGGLSIRRGLAIAQEANLPTTLETATQGNVDLYRALGFALISEWSAPLRGPRFWTMACPPRR